MCLKTGIVWRVKGRIWLWIGPTVCVRNGCSSSLTGSEGARRRAQRRQRGPSLDREPIRAAQRAERLSGASRAAHCSDSRDRRLLVGEGAPDGVRRVDELAQLARRCLPAPRLTRRKLWIERAMFARRSESSPIDLRDARAKGSKRRRPEKAAPPWPASAEAGAVEQQLEVGARVGVERGEELIGLHLSLGLGGRHRRVLFDLLVGRPGSISMTMSFEAGTGPRQHSSRPT